MPGGSGGGSIVVLAKGAVSNHGTISANGQSMPTRGGGGGGACGGSGGNGGLVSTTGNPNAGQDGTAGHVIVTQTGPGSLFLATSAWGDDAR
jgi:hypothetical protein